MKQWKLLKDIFRDKRKEKKYNVNYYFNRQTGVSDIYFRKYRLIYVNFQFILLKMQERVFPSILFPAFSVKVKINHVSRYSGVMNYNAVLSQVMNAL